MKTSIFNKVHRDILLEFVYDDGNVIAEPFYILNNTKDRQLSYIGSFLSKNSLDSNLFPIDIIQNKWGKIDTTSFTFLRLDNYTTAQTRHDTIKLHFPQNWNFGEYLGVFLRVYCYDSSNTKIVNLSNFFFNKYDSAQSNFIGEFTPPLLYENRIWNRRLDLEIPSVNELSLQRTSGIPISGSISDLVTAGVGISITTPIFIDFSFILGTPTIGGRLQYILSTPFTIQVPQTPTLENLQLFVQESLEGDFFEAYPIYNNTFENFEKWVQSSRQLGIYYTYEIILTLFEENIKGKTYRYLVDSDPKKIEWRPIIKSSSTNVVIDVEPEQTSKYNLSIKKIRVKDVQKPKIYVKESVDLPQIDSVTRNERPEITVDVDVPVIFDLSRIHAYSPNNLSPKVINTLSNYYPLGVMKILLTPFDNIIKFTLANKKEDSLNFIDLTNSQNLKLTFKTQKQDYDYSLSSEESDLGSGTCAFRIPQSGYTNLKKSYNLGFKLFYITTTNKDVRTVIYSGIFMPSDSDEATELFEGTQVESGGGDIILQVESGGGDIILQEEFLRGDALVTRRRILI